MACKWPGAAEAAALEHIQKQGAILMYSLDAVCDASPNATGEATCMSKAKAALQEALEWARRGLAEDVPF